MNKLLENSEIAQSDITKIIKYSQELQTMFNINDNLEDWVKAKLNHACDYVATVRDYLKFYKDEKLDEKWSVKYKRSIDCNNPKGFGQKAHCRARKLRQSGKETKSKPVKEIYKQALKELLAEYNSSMAMGSLKQINNDAKELESMLSAKDSIEDWVKAKLNLAGEYLDDIYHHLDHFGAEGRKLNETIHPMKLKDQIKEIYKFAKKCMMNEKLVLQRSGDKIYVISDDPDEKKKPFKDWETVRNKSKLKSAGFSFDGTAWFLPKNKLTQAQQIISQINNSPIEKLIDNIEDLPEFINASEDFSKKNELSIKIEGFVNALSGEVDQVKASEMFRKYLEFSSKFYKYSVNNTMLIYIQRPNATKVGSFGFWKKNHRMVKKGAKAIWIYKPITIKDDDFDGKNTPGLDDDVKKIKVVGFKPTPVFDISDTVATSLKGEIPELPSWHGNITPDEKADKLLTLGLELSNNLGIKADRASAMGGEMGWASGDHINITSNIAGAGAFGTLVHEIAHSLMHFKESSPFFIDDEKDLTKEEKELQAETVSYVVLKHYDIPVQHHPIYLAHWKANKESFQKSMGMIKKVSSFIIDKLDQMVNKEKEVSSESPTT